MPETAIFECAVCLRPDCQTEHRACSGEPPDEAVPALAARGVVCVGCGAQLLWAAEFCGFCLEERDAALTTTNEGDDR